MGDMLVPSIPVANTDAEQNEEEKEGTGIVSSANLKCSIIEVVGRDEDSVGVVVTNSNMLVGI